MNNSVIPIVSLGVGVVALALGGFLLYQIQSLLKLKRTFFAGGKAVDLEELLHSIALHIQELEKVQESALKDIEILEHNTSFSIQKVGVIRFNPFQDGGGNLSFSIALLDGNNSGFVITSMHGREQNRIYTKRLDRGKSENQLTEEEESAIRLAEENYHSTVIQKAKIKSGK